MLSPQTWIATGVSSIGMLCLLLFSAPRQAAYSIQQRYRSEPSMFALSMTSFAPPVKLARLQPALVRQQETAAPAAITITLEAGPASRQDFRFHGDLGDFRLDQAEPDDGDVITQTVVFTVTPGSYQVQEETPVTWHLQAIRCTLTEQTEIEMLFGQATLTVKEGDRMSCTFVNTRGVIIRTRSYHDGNGDRAPSLGENYLSNHTIRVYRDQNIGVGAQVTNQFGKANFNYLPPGEYAVCATLEQGWTNSQPGLTDPVYGSPCYTLILHPGEMATLWFGLQSADDSSPVPLPIDPRELVIAQGADVTSDDNGYDEWEFVDTDMNHDERGPIIFLPLAFIS